MIKLILSLLIFFIGVSAVSYSRIDTFYNFIQLKSYGLTPNEMRGLEDLEKFKCPSSEYKTKYEGTENLYAQYCEKILDKEISGPVFVWNRKTKLLLKHEERHLWAKEEVYIYMTAIPQNFGT